MTGQRITVDLGEPWTMFTDDAAAVLVGQSVALSMDGAPAGDAHVVRAFVEAGMLRAELEVPDAVGSRLVEGASL